SFQVDDTTSTKLFGTTTGVFSADVQYIPCPIANAEGVRFYIETASNSFFVDMRVQNHRHGIAKAEIDNAGTFTEMTRMDDNTFRYSSSSSLSTVNFRITDKFGQPLTHSMALTAGLTELADQLKDCPK